MGPSSPNFIMKLLTYYHTIKYLKLSQIFYRLLRRFKHPKPNDLAAIVDQKSGKWVTQALYEQKLFLNNKVKFLNREGQLPDQSSWNNESFEKLWLYNLHYFDDLNAVDADSRRELQISTINKWILENPAPKGNGWEPYPTSLRIVNWVKAFLSGLKPEQSMLDSLAKQSDFLSQDLERHLLGNHLFVNAKALIFAGTYLKGKESAEWLLTGLDIYRKELEEQVLDDGGNFELTPMYHVIMLVDLLDFINLWSAYPEKIDSNVVNQTRRVAFKMIYWLLGMSHLDGEISFFNDSAFLIAPKNSTVLEYAQKLGLINVDPIDVKHHSLNVYDFSDSGYVSVKTKEYSLIADLAQVGPSYQPGHAHADTLSYELAIAGQRVFVNSGTSEYGLSAERLRQRKTAAHNTVVVDDLDSSQVWSGFRVAKRADVFDRFVGPCKDGTANFGASHNGFKKQGVACIHKREWLVTQEEIRVVDRLLGQYSNAIGFLHLHPGVQVVSATGDVVELLIKGYKIFVEVHGGKISVESSSWHPEFGISIPSKKLSFIFFNNEIATSITWNKLD